MLFNSSLSGGEGLLSILSKATGAKIKNDTLLFPESFGKGYGKSYDLGAMLKMMIYEFELVETLTMKRSGETRGKEFIAFSFRNVFQHNPVNMQARTTPRLLPSVQVSSGNIDIEIVIPAGIKQNALVIVVHLDLLKDLLHENRKNKLLKNILSGDKPYLYDQFISPDISKAASSIFKENAPKQLSGFYLKLKAQEMLYLFFVELLKRENISGYPLNRADVSTMYKLRDRLLSDLSIPPALDELTAFANMSESKMNRLFKQIFGNSIYNYYQSVRMKEAAYLLKEEKLSVSETGYKLGFSNLSHFTRLFETHIGMKPKKYSLLYSS
jgi:AraC-like DNA-binding protein